MLIITNQIPHVDCLVEPIYKGCCQHHLRWAYPSNKLLPLTLSNWHPHCPDFTITENV
jgi:hypothetical protein